VVYQFSPVGMIALAMYLVLLAACQATDNPTPTAALAPLANLSDEQVITLGDVDPDEPTKKLERFQPLADYLAKHLKPFGIQEGRVLIARDIEEMARFLADGTVDVYFDSPFPSLAVQEISGSEIILRRWKGGDPEYWSTYIALRGSGIGDVEDFVGKVVAFEEPHSTSGFILPAGTLVDRGIALTEVGSVDATVASDEIGYFFSRDEENTVELVLQGRVAGGGLSNQDYDELPAELKDRIVAFDRTITVPRQLVSIWAGLEPALSSEVGDLLTGLDQTDEGRHLLQGLKKTKRFDALPSASESALTELKALMKLVSQ